MKKSILLLFAALLPLVASAEKVEINGIWYHLVPKAKQAEVTYQGDNSWDYNEYSGSITLPATVTYNGVAYSVTSIGDWAFLDCSSLTSITIPEGVTSIGWNAFSGCSSLTAITIPEGVTSIGDYAFAGCSSLTSITIPEGVTSIGWSAFNECSSLTAIVLPKNLNYIDSKAFANCSELLDVYCYAEEVPSTEADAFDSSFPKYVTLYVPASALETYKTTSPWSSFGTIVSLTDEETGIKNSELNIQNPELIYDLRGRRVEKAEKGIYIVNGKKTVIK